MFRSEELRQTRHEQWTARRLDSMQFRLRLCGSMSILKSFLILFFTMAKSANAFEAAGGVFCAFFALNFGAWGVWSGNDLKSRMASGQLLPGIATDSEQAMRAWKSIRSEYIAGRLPIAVRFVGASAMVYAWLLFAATLLFSQTTIQIVFSHAVSAGSFIGGLFAWRRGRQAGHHDWPQLCGAMFVIFSLVILLGDIAMSRNSYEAAVGACLALVCFDCGAWLIWYGNRLNARIDEAELLSRLVKDWSLDMCTDSGEGRRRGNSPHIRRIQARFAGGSLMIFAWVLLAAALNHAGSTPELAFSCTSFACCFVVGLIIRHRARPRSHHDLPRL